MTCPGTHLGRAKIRPLPTKQAWHLEIQIMSASDSRTQLMKVRVGQGQKKGYACGAWSWPDPIKTLP